MPRETEILTIVTFLPETLSGPSPVCFAPNGVEFLCAEEDPTTLGRGNTLYAAETAGGNLMGKTVSVQFGGEQAFASLRC